MSSFQENERKEKELRALLIKRMMQTSLNPRFEIVVRTQEVKFPEVELSTDEYFWQQFGYILTLPKAGLEPVMEWEMKLDSSVVEYLRAHFAQYGLPPFGPSAGEPGNPDVARFGGGPFGNPNVAIFRYPPITIRSLTDGVTVYNVPVAGLPLIDLEIAAQFNFMMAAYAALLINPPLVAALGGLAGVALRWQFTVNYTVTIDGAAPIFVSTSTTFSLNFNTARDGAHRIIVSVANNYRGQVEFQFITARKLIRPAAMGSSAESSINIKSLGEFAITDDDSKSIQPDEFVIKHFNTDNHCAFLAHYAGWKWDNKTARAKEILIARPDRVINSIALNFRKRSLFTKFAAEERAVSSDEFFERFNFAYFQLLSDLTETRIEVYDDLGHLMRYPALEYKQVDGELKICLVKPPALVDAVYTPFEGSDSDGDNLMESEAWDTVRLAVSNGHCDPILPRLELLQKVGHEKFNEMTKTIPIVPVPMVLKPDHSFAEWENYALLTFDIETFTDPFDSQHHIPYAIGVYGGIGWPKGYTKKLSAHDLKHVFPQKLHKIHLKYHQVWTGKDCLDQFFQWLIDFRDVPNVYLYGHNASNYDCRLLREHILSLAIKYPLTLPEKGQITNDQSIISQKFVHELPPVRIGNSNKFLKPKIAFTFLDSQRMVDGSLDALSKDFKVAHPKKPELVSFDAINEYAETFMMLNELEIDANGEEFRSFPDIFDAFPGMAEYFENDLKAPFEVLQAFRAVIEPMYRIPIFKKMTIAGLGRDIWYKTLPRESVVTKSGSVSLVPVADFQPDKLTKEIDLRIRPAYGGGRTEAFYLTTNHDPLNKVWMHDFTSHYPNCGIRFKFPWQHLEHFTLEEPEEITNLSDFNDFIDNIADKHKFSHTSTFTYLEVQAKAKFDRFSKDKWMALHFTHITPEHSPSPRTVFPMPVNWYDFHTNSAEVAMGLDFELYDYRIKSGDMFWSFNGFADFFNTMYKLKADAKKYGRSAEAKVMKLILNALTGSFGIRLDDRRSILMIPKTSAERLLSLINQEVVVSIHSYKDWEIVTIQCDYDAAYSNVAMSAAFTSFGRMELTRLMLAIVEFGGQCYYCDTDSVMSNLNLEALAAMPAASGTPDFSEWFNAPGEMGQLETELFEQYSYDCVFIVGAKMYLALCSNPAVPVKLRAKSALKGLKGKNKIPKVEEIEVDGKEGDDNAPKTLVNGFERALRPAFELMNSGKSYFQKDGLWYFLTGPAMSAAKGYGTYTCTLAQRELRALYLKGKVLANGVVRPFEV